MESQKRSDSGHGTEFIQDFKNKRFTITNYEDLKSGKISTVQIDGKDRSVSFLTTASERLTAREIKDRAKKII